jgi:ATP-binding cassette subfamily B protein
MVAKHYKRSIPLQLLREETQIGKEGLNLLGISEKAVTVGFRTKEVKIDTAILLKDARLPND